MDGEAPEEEKPMPDVPPPDFINACKAVLLNFGNLQIDEERGDLSTQIKLIASEAEVVATRIYGKGMTAREQQVRTIMYCFYTRCVHEYSIMSNQLPLSHASRIVHGKSKRPQSLTWKHLKLRQREEEKWHLGPILTPMMIFCLGSTLMERCALEGNKQMCYLKIKKKCYGNFHLSFGHALREKRDRKGMMYGR